MDFAITCPGLPKKLVFVRVHLKGISIHPDCFMVQFETKCQMCTTFKILNNGVCIQTRYSVCHRELLIQRIIDCLVKHQCLFGLLISQVSFYSRGFVYAEIETKEKVHFCFYTRFISVSDNAQTKH